MKEKNSIMRKIVKNMSRVIIGKEGPSRLMVIALASSGHILIEDVPGIGKTTMANSITKSVVLS